ncbi:hypothetical protein [Sphingobium sp. CECT 9361]|uniref:hypothetical protein n=1 Tax=Sphingobium sp. CECT 9361 TaxID=2845384 RepID=UPI001E2A6171|nr:hypothetical protein [Sphingobium sp. CECT 9361]CAH0350598.1 hypothetical protein SPH9361_01291 [Sphingobium sp. CECT 9361]
MSLISILSTFTSGSSSATGNSVISAAQARLVLAQAAQEKADAKSRPSTGDVQISPAATLAQANKADQAKNFGVLAKEMRAILNSQYKAGSTSPDFAKISGRGLASIVLNEGHQFSQEEQAAARAALKGRERDVLTTALSSGMSVATLASYGKTLEQNYDTKSPEERKALGYTEQTRINAARMAGTKNISLFDELD